MALGRIEPRQRGYIEYRFGFDDEDTERTLTQTARHFHLSESRARMTERQALDDVRLELPWWCVALLRPGDAASPRRLKTNRGYPPAAPPADILRSAGA